MTADAYNNLEITEQIRLALQSDLLVGHRGEGPRSMHLYMVQDFYVEIVFTTRKKEVLRVAAFTDGAALEPYLDMIDLSELFE